MRFNIYFILMMVLLILGCARPYKNININAIPFKDYTQGNKVSYSIRRGVMFNTKNYFFAKREIKNNVSLVAFKISNNTSLPISTNDLLFSCGATSALTPIGMQEFCSLLKQKAGLYWLYAAGVVVYPRPPIGSKKFIPLPFGIPVAAVNFGIATKANKKLNGNLRLLDLSNRMIQPGDTIQGLLPFRGINDCSEIFINLKD